MTSEEYQKRLERAQNEMFVIARTEEGFRIHAPANGGHVYYVTGSPESPACSCPDFQHHANDPTWRCKHILAVLARNGGGREAEEPAPGAPANGTEASRLILKRSVSPDGRIDALSVEFSLPVNGSTSEAIETRAREVLGLQDTIAKGFLKRNNPSTNGNGQPTKPSSNGVPVPATILAVGGMNGKWGRRMFLTFLVNGRNLRLFGTESQLRARVTEAGYAGVAERLSEGQRLDLPCRVTTEPSQDGKYVNVATVLPSAVVPAEATW